MAEKIRIFSKKTFRFPNPNITILKAPGATPSQKAFDKAYFQTTPNEVQDAPAWIKQDEQWDWALRDGNIMEIAIVAASPVLNPKNDSPHPIEDEAAAAVGNAQAKEKADEKAKAAAEDDEEDDHHSKVDLNALTKSQLVDHALEHHDTELDPKLKHAELVQEIEKLRKEDKKENA